MNASYIVQTDVENYIEGWVTDDPVALGRLMYRAEHYIDLCCANRQLTFPGAVQQVVVSGNPTTGSFSLAYLISGTTYTSTLIPFNSTPATMAAAIQASGIPGSVSAYAAEGERNALLPAAPINLCFRGSLKGVPVPLATVPANTTGGVVTPVILAPGGPLGISKRFDPASMHFHQFLALKDAVCAQVEYMFNSKDSLFSESQYSRVKGPDFQTEGRLPTVSPKVRRELAMGGIVVGPARMTRSRR